MKKGRVILDKIKNVGKKLALLVLATHLGTQAVYLTNRAIEQTFPSKMAQQMRDNYGIKLSEIGKLSGNQITWLGEVLERESNECDLGTKNIQIVSKNYFRKPTWDQLEEIFGTGYNGRCLYSQIWLNEDVGPSTVHHEIKHAKTFAIAKKHPEFLRRWKELAKDKNGNSLYDSKTVRVASEIKGLSRLIKRNPIINKDNEALGFVSDYARTDVYEELGFVSDYARTDVYEELGFVSDYARTDVYEDIAELCGETERSFFSSKLTATLTDGQSKNDILSETPRGKTSWHLEII